MKANLLILFVDGQSRQAIGAYGNSLAATPHIDALAEGSIVFDRAYVTQPVGTASMSSLLSGLFPHSSGCTENNLPLEPGTLALPELVDSDEYSSGYIGKWHLGDEVFRQHGFGEWTSVDDSRIDYYSANRDKRERSSFHHYLRSVGFEPDDDHESGPRFSPQFVSKLPEERSATTFVADSAIKFLDTHRAAPFILCVDFPRYDTSIGSGDRIDIELSDVLLPSNHFDDLASSSLKSRLLAHAYRRRGSNGIGLETAEGWRGLIRANWERANGIDTAVADILASLRRSGVEDRTIVLLASDHGEMAGSHRLAGACVMYEEAVCVPSMIKLPDIFSERLDVSSRRYSAPMSQIDLIPTLLDLLDRPIPGHLEGSSLVANLSSPELTRAEPTSEVIVEWNGLNSGFGDILGDTLILPEWRELADDFTIRAALDDPIRTLITQDGWKYSWSHRGEDQLFHLQTDPGEMNNLVNDGHSGRVASFRRRIESWQRDKLDPVVYG